VAFGVFYPKSMKAYLSYSLGALSIFGFIACCFIWFNTTFPCILMIESLESLISFSNTHCNPSVVNLFSTTHWIIFH
jgi:hypothetical protein